MSKGLRSNRKKALRTIRRNDVRSSAKFVENESRRLASLQRTAEAGREARERRAGDIATQPMETEIASTEPAAEAMELDQSIAKRVRKAGIPVAQKKQLKIQRKKKADGINTLHKKSKKGKRK